jgi:hypothetical protein
MVMARCAALPLRIAKIEWGCVYKANSRITALIVCKQAGQELTESG